MFNLARTWNEERTSFNNSIIVDNREAKGNDGRLVNQTLSGEPVGGQDIRNSGIN